MRIVCPSCSAAYEVPDTMLAGRRTVRCFRCAREWQLAGPDDYLDAGEVEGGYVDAGREDIGPPPPPAPLPAPDPLDDPALERRSVSRASLTRVGMARELAAREHLARTSAPADIPVAERYPADRPLAIDRLMATPRSRAGASPTLKLAWVASIVLILALLAAAYVWRGEVMDAWPPSARLYGALGLR